MNWLEQAMEWLEDLDEDNGDAAVKVAICVAVFAWCVGWIR